SVRAERTYRCGQRIDTFAEGRGGIFMSALTLRGIEKRFAGLQVLSGIDLTVEDGERHAVIGPNGAGKSTLFNIISGLVPPTSGQVFFRNKDITHHSPQDLARIGIGRSFQIINIFPALTV